MHSGATGSRVASLAAAVALAACSRDGGSAPKPPAEGSSQSSPAPSPRASAAPAPSFPELPLTPEAAAELVRRETVRPPASARDAAHDGGDPHTPGPAGHDVDAAAILAAVAARPGAVVAGEGPAARSNQGFLDSGRGRRLRALRHLARRRPARSTRSGASSGPGGCWGLNVVAVELFRADGAWAGAPIELSRGDGAAIDAYVAQGDPEAFAGLARSDRDAKTTLCAWKLGYEATVLDLPCQRARHGGPLPRLRHAARLQEKSGAPGDLRLRLREIDCPRSLPPVPGGRPRRAAMLWGEAHVKPDGLRRFLPLSAAALSLHVFGRRLSAGPVEAGARPRALRRGAGARARPARTRPRCCCPTRRSTATSIGCSRPRSRARPSRPGVVAHADEAGVLVLGERWVPSGRSRSRSRCRQATTPTCSREAGGGWWGRWRIDAGHQVELDFEVKSGLTRYVERAPR